MRKSTLQGQGNFYKGNLHTHTTVSDGRQSPRETVEFYKENGYDFLALTDHDIYGIHEALNTKDFIVLAGVEAETWLGQTPPLYRVHHLLAIGDPDKNKYRHGHFFDSEEVTSKLSCQELIDELSENGNLVIYNHPHWSKTSIEEVAQLKGLNGLEIYNHISQVGGRSGNAELFYDHLLWQDNLVWCYGADDAHVMGENACGGYITVKAPELTRRAVFDALVSGSFYASAAEFGKTAPEIYDFYVEDGIAKIWCSPSTRIYFMTGQDAKTHHDLDHHQLTVADYKIPKESSFVRAVCVDQYGYTSWTQPIKL